MQKCAQSFLLPNVFAGFLAVVIGKLSKTAKCVPL